MPTRLVVENPPDRRNQPEECIPKHETDDHCTWQGAKHHQKAADKTAKADTAAASQEILKSVLWIKRTMKPPNNPEKRIPSAEARTETNRNKHCIPCALPSLGSCPRSSVIFCRPLCEIAHDWHGANIKRAEPESEPFSSPVLRSKVRWTWIWSSCFYPLCWQRRRGL